MFSKQVPGSKIKKKISVGEIPRNLIIFIFSLNCQFRGEIMIIIINYEILVKFPEIDPINDFRNFSLIIYRVNSGILWKI